MKINITSLYNEYLSNKNYTFLKNFKENILVEKLSIIFIILMLFFFVSDRGMKCENVESTLYFLKL